MLRKACHMHQRTLITRRKDPHHSRTTIGQECHLHLPTTTHRIGSSRRVTSGHRVGHNGIETRRGVDRSGSTRTNHEIGTRGTRIDSRRTRIDRDRSGRIRIRSRDIRRIRTGSRTEPTGGAMQGADFSNIVTRILEKSSATCRSRGASTGTPLGRRQLGIRLAASGTTCLEGKNPRSCRHSGTNRTIVCTLHHSTILAVIIPTEAETRPTGGTTTLPTETSVPTQVAVISIGTGDRILPSAIHSLSVAVRRNGGGSCTGSLYSSSFFFTTY
jgi:hypothetical protein